MVLVRWRPIDGAWPGSLTPDHHRKTSPFTTRASDGSWRRVEVSFRQTLDLLDRELHHLGARNVVFQVALDEVDFRLDGEPRANAKARHPGVICAFDSKYGPLKYATDVFRSWQTNIRAIALALEALRKVDRYGVTKRGEQYTGWKALPPGTGIALSQMSTEEAASFLYNNSGAAGEVPVQVLLTDVGCYRMAWRDAVKRLHPDVGGDRQAWDRLQVAKAILDRHHGILGKHDEGVA